MTGEKFDIVVDTSKCLLRITFRGLWKSDDVRAYQAALAQASERLRAASCARGRTIVLVDARAIGPQSQDVITEYKASMGGEATAVRRLATLVTSALFKRQVERIAIANQRLFTEEDEALAWLLSPDDAA